MSNHLPSASQGNASDVANALLFSPNTNKKLYAKLANGKKMLIKQTQPSGAGFVSRVTIVNAKTTTTEADQT